MMHRLEIDFSATRRAAFSRVMPSISGIVRSVNSRSYSPARSVANALPAELNAVTR